VIRESPLHRPVDDTIIHLAGSACWAPTLFLAISLWFCRSLLYPTAAAATTGRCLRVLGAVLAAEHHTAGLL